MRGMYLKCHKRFKDGKEHRYWSIAESVRTRNGVSTRQVLYLGEINDSQRAQWCSAIEVVDGGDSGVRQMSLFPDDRNPPEGTVNPVRVRLDAMTLHRPRQWGGCWLSLELWGLLELETFWAGHLPDSRKGTRWTDVLAAIVTYRLLDPGSEWRMHREWFRNTAMADLLGCDESAASKNTLYRCLAKLCEHKDELFKHLRERWGALFGAKCDILLYDLTSTYFECDVPGATGLRRFGYSRDKRPDCVQVVIALVVTPDGLPVAYETMQGSTSDKTTLKDFLAKIEKMYGKAGRTWIMDRGIPTEEVLGEMREAKTSYLVGTPRGRLTKLQREIAGQPWRKAREGIEVKTAAGSDGDTYVLTRSCGRRDKEQAMRRRRLRILLRRLGEISQMKGLSRDDLVAKVAVARHEAGRAAARAVDIKLTAAAATFSFCLNRAKLRDVRRGEGTYLLRTNLPPENPEDLWRLYITLTEVEQAFKDLKNDLSIRPVYHQTDEQIEAHIFAGFLAYCLFATLKLRSRGLAPGLTPRAVLDKFKTVQMIDVHFPTTDGRTLVLPRYTQPDKDLRILLHRLDMQLPEQPPPRIEAPSAK